MKITLKQKNQIAKLAKNYGLKLVLFFGSRAKGKYIYPESDFDIAILPKKELDLMDEGKISTDLMGIFKTNEIDLTNLETASPLLKYQVITNKNQILYEERVGTFDDFEVYAFRRYIEAKPLFNLIEQSVKNFTKNLKVKV